MHSSRITTLRAAHDRHQRRLPQADPHPEVHRMLLYTETTARPIPLHHSQMTPRHISVRNLR